MERNGIIDLGYRSKSCQKTLAGFFALSKVVSSAISPRECPAWYSHFGLKAILKKLKVTACFYPTRTYLLRDPDFSKWIETLSKIDDNGSFES
ncbi:hypothetical protein [Streptococcus ovuberis]|uniref:Uncharacterized protein n=1 Tax=Streptococcus ovuberis TaxID=1936207 RepID=A0A7X6S058_9STRE|nr:hypothetical protein [Streptococcus ovuberis]NKZ19863.1 hypothetical protein [Streptococcus ovuberis]